MADVRIKYRVDKGELVLARNELDKINKELGVTKKESNKAAGALKLVGGAIIAAFTIDKLVDFGKQVIAVTAEFDKLRAVLTNTLGSKSQADAAFTRLQEFASKTPFQVTQLTASFVKLANQGFVPTNEELRKLGDLAASTGKDFDMLTEAIIDAQVGEFERLKEFGIRASKQGDQVTFAFKGVETQTKFTQDAIREYLLSLGDLEGVSGSMAAVSKTLGGQISNLEDSFDALFYALGQATTGIISKVLTALNAAVETVTRIINAANGISSQASEELNKLNEEFRDLESPEDYEKAIDQISKRIETLKANVAENTTQATLLKASQSDVTDAFKNQAPILDTLSSDYVNLAKNTQDLASLLEATGEATEGTTAASTQATGSFSDLNTAVVDQSIELGVLEQFLLSLIQDYEKLKGATSKQTEAWNIQRKSVDDLIDRYSEMKKLFSDVTDQTTTMGENVQDLTNENAKLNMKLIEQNDITRRSAKAQQDLANEEARILEERQLKREAFFDAANLISNELFDRQQQRLADELSAFKEQSDKKLAKLEEERDRKIAIAGQNKAAILGIEKEFEAESLKLKEEVAQKEREMKRRQAISDKLQAIFEIQINTASAVVQALPNLVLAGIIAGIGQIQTALVLSRPLPKYAKGVLSLQGPGTETSDSIPALLSRGESVMTSNETRDFMPTLKAIRENRIDPKLLNAVSEGKMKGSESTPTIVEVPRDSMVWDEDGFSYYMHRKNITVQRKNARYKC